MEVICGSNDTRSLCLKWRRCLELESYRTSGPATNFLAPEKGGNGSPMGP